MKTYIVYRLDYPRRLCEPVGKMIERRSKERVKNTDDLLQLAQGLYPTPSQDSHLVITPE